MAAVSDKKVVVAGHACLDITPIFPQNENNHTIQNPLIPGKLIEMEGVEISAGGAVSNTGIAMKLLGANVTLLTKTGSDEFAGLLKQIYAKYDVADGVLQDDKVRTSYSAVIAMPGIDRIFLHDPGANHTFGYEDIQKAELSDVALFHFGYPPLMKRMYQNDGEELFKLMKYVHDQGIVTSLDMAAVDPNSEAGRADWKQILKKVLPYVDIFVPSAEELCFMLDRDRLTEWNERAEGGDITEYVLPEDVKPLGQMCLEYGVKILLVKCGAKGMYYQTCQKEKIEDLSQKLELNAEEWANQSGFEKSYKPSKVLSATGAGDTTIAAFLTALLSGYSPEMCLHLAAGEGACCVEGYGALDGIKSLKELEEKIELGWEKNL